MPDRRTRRKGRKGSRHRGGSIASTLRMPFVSSPAAGPVGYGFQGGDIETWPGMVGNEAGITMSNHYPYNTNVVDPPISSSNTQCGPCKVYNGGKKRGSRAKRGGKRRTGRKTHGRRKSSGKRRTRAKRSKRAGHGFRGGFTSNDMVNFWRNQVYDVKKRVADWRGVELPASANPNPTQQPIENNPKVIVPKLPNIKKIYRQAAQEVAKI